MKKLKMLTFAAAAAYLIRREYFHGLEYICNLSLCRGSKAFLFNCNNITAELKALENIRGEFKYIKQWARDAQPQKQYISGCTGRAVFLRIFKRPSHRWVIAVHGYGCTGRSMLYCAKKFYDKNFNVVVPDLPCHGRSYGRFIGMGQYEYKDILKIADHITAQDKSAQIMLYGISMGAATVLSATGAQNRPEIRCAVSDCSYSSARSELGFQIHNIFHLPAFLIIHDLDKVYRKKTGFSLKNADMERAVKNSVTPTLFIHGGADKIVPTNMVYKLYNAAACPKDILIIKDAGHGVSAVADITTYWSKVFAFADKYMSQSCSQM